MDTSSMSQVVSDQRLKQLVPVRLADKSPGIVMVGDISGVLRQNIAHNLIDGVIALLLQGLIYRCLLYTSDAADE